MVDNKRTKEIENMQKTRYIPSGYTLYKKTPNTEVYANQFEKGGKMAFAAIGYIGGSSKHSFHYGYPRETDMAHSVNEFTNRVESNIAVRNANKIRRKIENENRVKNVKVGDLFAYSWGYDQTNVEFFQVIEKKAKSFVIAQIHGKQVGNSAGGPMSADVSPVKDAFFKSDHALYKKPMLKTNFSMPHGALYPTTEAEKHYNSWYA